MQTWNQERGTQESGKQELPSCALLSYRTSAKYQKFRNLRNLGIVVKVIVLAKAYRINYGIILYKAPWSSASRALPHAPSVGVYYARHPHPSQSRFTIGLV
jgi:hypothetical protein